MDLDRGRNPLRIRLRGLRPADMGVGVFRRKRGAAGDTMAGSTSSESRLDVSSSSIMSRGYVGVDPRRPGDPAPGLGPRPPVSRWSPMSIAPFGGVASGHVDPGRREAFGRVGEGARLGSY